ncbi:EAL domain-containing protein [Thiohalobacter sp.]|uniref:EAL domain-containing protein n=1 Tax=Thiohalobacter sp. TaxID=2025948 RepID=UPI0026393E27|nr:EAL domain-containing protein [Thiohalobacter sp.]
MTAGAARHLLAMVLLVAGLAWTYLAGRMVDPVEPEGLRREVSDVAAAEASLHEYLLGLYIGLVRDYDGVNRELDAIDFGLQAVAQRLDRLDTGDARPLFDAARRQYADKQAAVERFKSENALVRNAIRYLLLASERLSEAGDGELDQAIARLSSDLLRLLRNPSPRNRAAVRDAVAAVAALDAARLPAAYRSWLARLREHAELVVMRMPRQLEQLDAVMEADIGQGLEQVALLVGQAQARRAAVAERYRMLSYVLSALLVAYVTYLFLRLQHNARVLADTGRKLRREKEQAETTLHAIADGVITTDGGGRIRYMNPVAEALSGWSVTEAAGRPLSEVLPLLDQRSGRPVTDPARQVVETDAPLPAGHNRVLIDRNRDRHVVRLSAAPLHGEDGEVSGAVVVVHDVSETQQLMEHISHQARHDPLTGLLNRRGFEVRLEATIRDIAREGGRKALCYLDLDQFKMINDSCGHVAGDQLLQNLVPVLRGVLGDRDLLARLGGDEFGVLADVADEAQAQATAQRLLDAVKGLRFRWGQHLFEPGASIGVVMIDAATVSAEELFRQADLACYAAKDLGRGRWHLYQPDDAELVRRSEELQRAAGISRALEEDRLRLHLQPIVDISGGGHGGIEHFEVLVRMIDEHGREVPPGVFIPAAERYNLMPAIDRWVVANALALLAALTGTDEHADCHFSVNLSGNSINDPELPGFIVAQLERHRVDPSRICFEITETAVISQLSAAIALIERLRDMGCSFALDDFGSGLSSFGYLKALPVDYLKIDGSFVRDMLNDPIDRAMVEAINRLGHIMGKKTIAEFVESEALVGALQALGVDQAQGYALGRPKPASELFDVRPAVESVSL